MRLATVLRALRGRIPERLRVRGGAATPALARAIDRAGAIAPRSRGDAEALLGDRPSRITRVVKLALGEIAKIGDERAIAALAARSSTRRSRSANAAELLGQSREGESLLRMRLDTQRSADVRRAIAGGPGGARMKPRAFWSDRARWRCPAAARGNIRLLRDLISERLGLFFGPELRSSLERRLREHVSGCAASARSPITTSSSSTTLGAEEWDEAELPHDARDLPISSARTSTSRRSSRSSLPVLAKKERKREIWSAGCSTGKEAYDRDADPRLRPLPAARGLEIRVHGSDLSKCIAAARRRGSTSARPSA